MKPVVPENVPSPRTEAPTAVPVSRFMTRTPHTIGADQTLSTAHKLMRDFGVRHLPVLKGGKLVGLVSQRDLHFVEALEEVDPAKIAVEEAMTPDPFTVGPDAAVETVAAVMASRRYGSAVITERAHVVGIFTTTDALRAVVALLEERRRREGG
jgi:acetoin utilization protein AcuB